MEKDTTAVLAAQVVNFLKGNDVAAVMRSSPEPLQTQIARIKDRVPESGANAMAESVSTREVIVATLRMRAVLEFMLRGESYFHGDQHKRIEGLLAIYGPEFPDEIKPEKYVVMAHRYYQEQFGTSSVQADA